MKHGYLENTNRKHGLPAPIVEGYSSSHRAIEVYPCQSTEQTRKDEIKAGAVLARLHLNSV